MRVKDSVKEDKIRQKAIEMIVKEGLYGFGINKLAKAAGVSPATIYIYFEDKEELISTICLEVGQALTEYSLRNFKPDMPFDQGLKIQWENRLGYFMKYPIEMEFLEIMRHTVFYERVTVMMTKEFGAVFTAFMDNAVRNSELMALPFEVYWSVAFAPLYQLIKFHNQGHSYVNGNFMLTDELMEQALTLVLKALRP